LVDLSGADPREQEGRAIVSFNRGIALYEVNRFDEARSEFLKALIHPALVDDSFSAMIDCASRIDIGQGPERR
jgi:hypothetical protein